MAANSDPLLFQILDIHTQDLIVLPDEADSDNCTSSESDRGSWNSDGPPPERKPQDLLALKHFQILLFGVDGAGRSICLQAEDFRPYFFIRLPTGLPARAVESLEEWIRDRVPERIQHEVQIRREAHKTLWDYTGGASADFLRVEVPSQALWRSLKDALLTKASTARVLSTEDLLGKAGLAHLTSMKTADDSLAFLSTDGKRVALKIYEANIDPVLRFFHAQDISPAGWVRVDAGEWEEAEGSAARVTVHAACPWTAVKPVNDKNALAPLKVASWDIECTSSHGDFPIACKTWRKPVREMAEAGTRCPTSIADVCEALAVAIRGEAGLLSPIFLKRTSAAFGPNTTAETLLHCLKGKNAMAAARLALQKLLAAEGGDAREDAIAALDAVLTKALPAICGDEIIQIGTVVYRQGAPLSKHIWVLGDVDKDAVKPPGAEVPIEVYAFSSELAMLKNWIHWIGKSNMDVLIGYNVFGFDERYIWDRMVELAGSEKAVKPHVLPWSRLRSRPPRLEEKFLSSSAMGDNTMYILGCVGRLQIDLLPYIRRSYNLDSYKLDNVSATFVSGAVTGAITAGAQDTFRIPTKSTKGTVVGRYITLLDTENDQVIEKCRVVGVEAKALTVHIEDGAARLADHGLAPERWAQVKDDVSPKDIFRLHKGSPADRATISRYCFPETDHQLLTNKGYLFLSDVIKLWGPNLNGPPLDESLTFAGFNPSTQQLVYERPNCLIVNEYVEDQDMVEFTQSAYKDRWDENNTFGLSTGQLYNLFDIEYEHENYKVPNFVSLITTPDHDMYARLGVATGDTGIMRMTTGKARIPNPFVKIKAEELLNKPKKTAIKFVGKFNNGVQQLEKVTIDKDYLGLYTDTQYLRFLELYGYWLGDGHLVFSAKKPEAVAFAIVKESDLSWLRETFAILDLKHTSIYKSNREHPPQIQGRLKSQSQYCIKISDKNYVDFFFSEYSCKYRKGDDYIPQTLSSIAAENFSKSTKDVINSILEGEKYTSNKILSTDLRDHEGIREHEGIKSAKWLMPWVWNLEKNDCRAILSGIVRADGSHHKGKELKTIFTSSTRFRDELERLALHAGYSPYSTVCYLSGSQRGISHDGKPIIANHTLWQVKFPEDIQFAEPTLKQCDGDIRRIQYSGRTWCVNMPSSFVVARRARTMNGIVTHASRPIVTGNCLQDCDLVMELFNKLDILNNSIAMANVCSVPVSFIFLRGQGIKIESLIFKECRKVDQLIEVLPSAPRDGEGDGGSGAEGDEEDEDGEDTYEGAIVLEPQTGIYIDDPVTADDFASLYPSSIISENISHDTLIWVKDYDTAGNFVCVREGSDRFDNLPGASYVNVEFDILRPDPAEAHKKHPRKIRDGKRVARYIQQPQGTIPRILEMLLASRKRCRKLAESESDEFTRNLLDAQQLAYKLTANSLYGQLGSGTFKVRRQVLAASTTGYGRKQLMYAKEVIESVYGGGRDPRCDVQCVYGDTDSIFLRFRPRDPVTGARLHGRAALQAAKDLTVESGKLVTSCLKPPHDFEFDKIFRSFILLSKKRYVGDMSEDGVEDDDFHRKSMGIVMKRRDNAPIVKYVYGHAVDKILNPPNLNVAAGVQEATAFVQKAARDLLAGRFPMTKLTITKSLRAEYKDPSRIAHKVLADRIAERDPGNKPSTSDRIPFVYIVNPKATLQGEKIELPSYIVDHGLRPDFAFYITNQIAKPVAQVFGLALEHMPAVRAADVRACLKARDPVDARERLANAALFEAALREAARDPAAMAARGQTSITSFFSGTSKK